MKSLRLLFLGSVTALVLAACGGGVTVSATGTWQGSSTLDSGDTVNITAKLNDNNGSITGTIGSLPATGSRNGNNLSLNATASDGSIQITGTINGNSFSGTITVTLTGQGSASGQLTMTRTSSSASVSGSGFGGSLKDLGRLLE